MVLGKSSAWITLKRQVPAETTILSSCSMATTLQDEIKMFKANTTNNLVLMPHVLSTDRSEKQPDFRAMLYFGGKGVLTEGGCHIWIRKCTSSFTCTRADIQLQWVSRETQRFHAVEKDPQIKNSIFAPFSCIIAAKTEHGKTSLNS